MKELIAPIDPALLKLELTEERLLRQTNAGGNTIYLIDAHNAPNTMLEIGRLREFTFRAAGGGTGKEADIDEYDTAATPFKQLIVWNEEAQEIVSAYRFILGKDVPLDENGYPHTPTSKLFCFSEKFIRNEWQQTIELGRSFVVPKYQAGNSLRLGLFSLDNIWDGLGALIVDYPEIKYFFGKMTMYNSYNRIARNMILRFMQKHFQGDETLVHPFESLPIEKTKFNDIFNHTLSEDFTLLKKNVHDLKVSIPPLIKSYMSLSPSMQFFGASPNREFGPVEEIAILIDVNEIYEDKKKRHIDSYKGQCKKQS